MEMGSTAIALMCGYVVAKTYNDMLAIGVLRGLLIPVTVMLVIICLPLLACGLAVAGSYFWCFALFAVLPLTVLFMMRSMQLRWTRTWAEKGGRARVAWGSSAERCNRCRKGVVKVELVLVPFALAKVVVALLGNVVKRDELSAKHQRAEILAARAARAVNKITQRVHYDLAAMHPDVLTRQLGLHFQRPQRLQRVVSRRFPIQMVGATVAGMPWVKLQINGLPIR